MCGILGLLAPSASPNLLPQLDLLAHRGPDDAGHYADADIFLGARRLSIIDVAHGHQPLANETRSVWVVQNGEIYNYRDLRAELEARGHTFRTQSDTEVIAHAYEAWGADCAAHLRGIFAFAVWDAARRRLFLARDRFGVKPLYYAALPEGGLAFASEIRPLLTLLPARPNYAALRALFTAGFVPGPLTAFEGVLKLPAAHTGTARAEASGLALSRYWDIQPEGGEAARPVKLAEAAEVFGGHLKRAVAEQRMSEVPLGALLSGGVDSASIAALLQAQSDERLHTFNISFEQPPYDETRFARLAAQHIGTQHHQAAFHESDFDRYPEVLSHLEEPQCSATALPIYLLYEACRQAGLTVILTGEGADELLGGYHWLQGDGRVRPLLRLPQAVRRLLASSPLRISTTAREVLRRGEADPVARYAQWQGLPAADGLLSPDLGGDGAVGGWREMFREALDFPEPFRQIQYLEAHTRLVDFINFEVDRMSMAHSIEARVPFLDHLLWEYAAGLPASLLSGRTPKMLLRAAMRPYLPAAVLARRKWGLAAPYAAWLRRERLPDWAEQALAGRAVREAGYFNPAAVQQLRGEHQRGGRSHSRLLMGVLSTQLWHRQFIAPA